MADLPDRLGVGPGYRSDHQPADGDRAEQGHAPSRSARSPSTRTRPTSRRSRRKLDAFKTAAADLSDAAPWKADADARVLGPDEGRRDAARRRRHRRPLDPGRPPRVLRAARLRLHAERQRGQDRRSLRPPAADDRPIDIAANATAADVAAAINANERPRSTPPSSRTAASTSLVFSSRKTGENSDFSVDTSRSAPAAAGRGQRLRAHGRDAQRVDQGRRRRGAEPRVQRPRDASRACALTLKGITASPASVTTTPPAVDTEAITKKVTALVDAYNAVVTATRPSSTEKKVPTAPRPRDLQKGQLFGDSGMNCMLRQLKTQMTQTVAGLGLTGLADLGIGVPKSRGATTQDAKDGKLTVDEEKLNERSPPTTRRSATCSPARAPPRASPALIATTWAARPAPTARSPAG